MRIATAETVRLISDSPVGRSARMPATTIRPLASRQPIVPRNASAHSAPKFPGREVTRGSRQHPRDPISDRSTFSVRAYLFRSEDRFHDRNPHLCERGTASCRRRRRRRRHRRREHGCVEPLSPSAVTIRTRVATYRRHFADRDGDHDEDEDASTTLMLVLGRR